jgi:hypothetical protein
MSRLITDTGDAGRMVGHPPRPRGSAICETRARGRRFPTDLVEDHAVAVSLDDATLTKPDVHHIAEHPVPFRFLHQRRQLLSSSQRADPAETTEGL